MSFRFSFKCALLGALAVAALAGCSTEQAYDTAQDWQRQGCWMINDAQERSRCLASTNQRYEDYKKETDALKKP